MYCPFPVCIRMQTLNDMKIQIYSSNAYIILDTVLSRKTKAWIVSANAQKWHMFNHGVRSENVYVYFWRAIKNNGFFLFNLEDFSILMILANYTHRKNRKNTGICLWRSKSVFAQIYHNCNKSWELQLMMSVSNVITTSLETLVSMVEGMFSAFVVRITPLSLCGTSTTGQSDRLICHSPWETQAVLKSVCFGVQETIHSTRTNCSYFAQQG